MGQLTIQDAYLDAYDVSLSGSNKKFNTDSDASDRIFGMEVLSWGNMSSEKAQRGLANAAIAA